MQSKEWLLSEKTYASTYFLGDLPQTGMHIFEPGINPYELAAKTVLPYVDPLSRLVLPKFARNHLWMGEPLEGKRLLLWGKFGRGDIIEWARYWNVFKRLPCSILVACSFPELLPLFEYSFAGIKFVNEADLQAVEFDFVAFTIGLPFLHASQPVKPYLKAPQMQLSGSRPKVGMCYAATDPYRSLPLADLAPIVNQDWETWVFGSPAQVEAAISQYPNLQHQPDQDWLEFAGLLQAMDALIVVDSGPLHLAGGLGLPAVALLPMFADRRWTGEQCNAYPSLHFIQQQLRGDWSQAISQAIEIVTHQFSELRPNTSVINSPAAMR